VYGISREAFAGLVAFLQNTLRPISEPGLFFLGLRSWKHERDLLNLYRELPMPSQRNRLGDIYAGEWSEVSTLGISDGTVTFENLAIAFQPQHRPETAATEGMGQHLPPIE